MDSGKYQPFSVKYLWLDSSTCNIYCNGFTLCLFEGLKIIESSLMAILLPLLLLFFLAILRQFLNIRLPVA